MFRQVNLQQLPIKRRVNKYKYLKKIKNHIFVFDILIFVKYLSLVCAPERTKEDYTSLYTINYQ